LRGRWELVSENDKVYDEKFKNMDEKIEKLTIRQDKIENKVENIDKKTDSVENNLSIKFIQLETKFDVYTKVTSDQIDKMGKEIKESNNEVKTTIKEVMVVANKPDGWNEFLKKWGLKAIESAITVGIGIAVAKGLL
jgi:hypothetical protein